MAVSVFVVLALAVACQVVFIEAVDPQPFLELLNCESQEDIDKIMPKIIESVQQYIEGYLPEYVSEMNQEKIKEIMDKIKEFYDSPEFFKKKSSYFLPGKNLITCAKNIMKSEEAKANQCRACSAFEELKRSKEDLKKPEGCDETSFHLLLHADEVVQNFIGEQCKQFTIEKIV